MTAILPMRAAALVLAALLTGVFAAGTAQARDPNEKYPRTCAERNRLKKEHIAERKREAELMRLTGGGVENTSGRNLEEEALFGKPRPAKPVKRPEGRKETR